MRDQSNAIRDQVSFKQREQHIRDSWDNLCAHYNLNKSDLVKFLIKKEEYFLNEPGTIPSRFMKDWIWRLGIQKFAHQCHTRFSLNSFNRETNHMTQTQYPDEVKTINLFFGHRHQDTLREFDDLSKNLRRSRTGTLHFLLTHYRWYEKHKMVSLWCRCLIPINAKQWKAWGNSFYQE